MGLAASAEAPTQGQQKNKGRGGAVGRSFPPPASAWEVADLVLGCPTDRSVVLAVHPKKSFEGMVVVNGVEGRVQKFEVEKPVQVTLSGLEPNSAGRYALKYKLEGESSFQTGPAHSFQTQRKPGSSFRFVVQGDSHPERNPKMNVPALYERTLRFAEELKPDFFICMGDDFSVDNLRTLDANSVRGAYSKQVPYLGLIGRTAPLFLVNGNHEQASKANLNGTKESIGVWTQTTRNAFFPQPAPDAFYSGNVEPVEHIGLLRNYFAYTWGDALFVTIDPYWHSEGFVDNALAKGPGDEGSGKRNRDLWDVTLGNTQYLWLAKTLRESSAKYKFVFAHHVHGTGRGMIEQAPFYEWGGKGRSGTDEFATRRPGWEAPIHGLFVKYGVTIFFQGHDHIFCRQTLDGVTYQSCPVPADGSNPLYNGDAYRSGDKVSGAGLVQVDINPKSAKVSFRRSYLPADEADGKKHGEVAFSYEVEPRSK